MQTLARHREVAELARHRGAVRLLWEVCQIPDFRKVMSESHTRLLAHIFGHLAGPDERLPTEWIAGQMNNLDRTEGDIDSLMARIAHIRTWTYITHRGDWVEGATAWQEQARAIEDRLSDALHDRITQRFVDRRSAFLVRRLASDDELLASVSAAGEVRVEGAYVGRLDGLRFVPDAIDGIEMRLVNAAANRVLRSEIADRARRLAADADAAFAIDAWRRLALARRRGRPPGCRRADADRRAPSRWPATLSRATCAKKSASGWRPLSAPRSSAGSRRCSRSRRCRSAAVGRGLAFQLADALGALPAGEVARQVAALSPADRAALGRHGVRFGTEMVYVEPLLRPDALRFRALLWAVRHGRDTPALPPARRLAKAIEVDPGFAGVVLCCTRLFCRRRPRLARRPAGTNRGRGAAVEPEWPVRRRRRALPRSPGSSRERCAGC